MAIYNKAYEDWEDACIQLHELVGDEDAEKIIALVRPEVNIYDTLAAGNRLERIIDILRAGFSSKELIPYIANRTDQYLTFALFGRV